MYQLFANSQLIRMSSSCHKTVSIALRCLVDNKGGRGVKHIPLISFPSLPTRHIAWIAWTLRNETSCLPPSPQYTVYVNITVVISTPLLFQGIPVQADFLIFHHGNFHRFHQSSIFH